MNDTYRIALSISLAVLLLGAASTATAQPLSADEALQTAWKHNPSLQSAANELERADLLVISQDGARVPLWTNDAGYRYGQTPRLSGSGTRLTTTDSLTLMSQLGYTFSPGTQLSAWFQMGRSVRDTVELGDLGGAIDTSVGVEISQPWLRGFGVDVVDASLKQAQAARRATAASQIATANSVAADVLSAYWSLWSAQQSLAIALESLKVTQREVDAGQIRVDAGVSAPAELVPLRIELASAEGVVVDAQARVRRASLELAHTMGVTATTELSASASGPPRANFGSLDESVALARAQSPDLIRLRANVDSAAVQARVAHNDALPSLSTTASIEAAGLGTNVGDAFGELAGFDALIGFVGVRLELPVSNRARKADAERADLAVQNARLDVERAELDLASTLAGLHSDADGARERLELARRTAALARENVEAQSARFEVGKSTPLEVTDAIQRLREADARVVDLEIELVEAQLAIGAATGALWAAR